MAETERGLMPPFPILLGIDEYNELPNDGKTYQIIDGVLYVNPAPVPRHQRVSKNLQFQLMLQLEKTGLGEIYNAPIDVILDKHTIVQPDLLFIRADRLNIVGEKNIQGPPDLVVEILSPSTRRTDVLIKSVSYARHQIPRYWLVDPAIDRIDAHLLADGSYRLEQTAQGAELLQPAGFPTLQLDLGAIF